jgi:uncharacterized protein YukJ
MTRTSSSRPPHQKRIYGCLVGRVPDGRDFDGGQGPHYEIRVAADHDYRIAVNVRSQDGSEVFAHFDPRYVSPSAKLDPAALAASAPGFTPIAVGPGGSGLDYLRDGLFPLDAMSQIPADGQGVTLANLLDAQIKRAEADAGAVVVAFGEYFEDGQPDPVFHFEPGRGVHDIHMMQGNGPNFARDNRINGDGALFIRYGDGDTVALFVRFATQSTATDEAGNPAD